MPLRCLYPDGSSILAFELEESSWNELAAENRKQRHLRMPCCEAQVSLRRSRRSTQFFAHKAVGACTTAPETETHLVLKKLAVEAARAAGWAAHSEVRGQTPDGEPWIADVLAEKDGRRVAIEIQWSPQTSEETMRRQERYRSSGIRGLWLFRRPGFPITRDLPAACIGGDLENGLTATLPRSGQDPLPIKKFMNAAFERRLKFGLDPQVSADLEIWTAMMDCWSCGCETKILSHVRVLVAGQSAHFGVDELGRLDLMDSLRPQLKSINELGLIKYRFSGTVGARYMSNGCAHCNALIGRFYEHHAELDDAPAISMKSPLSSQWRKAMEEYGWDETWWVDLSRPVTRNMG